MFRRYRLCYSAKHICFIQKRVYSLPPNFSVSQNLKNNKSNSYQLNIEDITDTLENDPNLENFYGPEVLNEINQSKNQNKEGIYDPYDFSSLPVDPELDSNPFLPDNAPRTMSTEEFQKMMAKENTSSAPKKSITHDDVVSTDEYLSQMINAKIDDIKPENTKGNKQSDNEFKKENPFHKLKYITEFLKKDDIPSYQQPQAQLSLKDLVLSELPLVIVSKLSDPRLNLSIEKYIYDNLPDPRKPINKFVKRLFLYKNSNCIVLGKNQNIYREINLRLASTYSIPILRRYSGGGTVVHDLGNYNFSFMCSKDDFNRTFFTGELIKKWNEYLKYASPSRNLFSLSLNSKGDMVRECDEKKISGSAFQISKGKSLHHGTMLLNSDLNTLGKLLKVNNNRLESITDKATNSIPSPIVNTNMNEDVFVELCIDSFVSKFGVPTNLSSKVEKLNKNNLSLIKHENSEVQILKIDDLTDLPSEIHDTYRELQSWDWIFGKSPRFQIHFIIDSGNMDLKFIVDKGRVISLEWDSRKESEDRLADLIKALLDKEIVVKFSTSSISKFIKDPKLMNELSWHIDQSVKLENIGTIL